MQDVNVYATHEHVAAEIGGERALRKIIPAQPDDSQDPTKGYREAAAMDVLKALGRRVPPVFETMLSVPSELKDVVVYGTLMRLYKQAITADGDRWSLLFREEKKRYESELAGLVLTVSNAASIGPTSIPVFRR